MFRDKYLRTLTLLFALLGIAISITLFIIFRPLLFPPREPQYQGKKLHAWLEKLNAEDPGWINPAPANPPDPVAAEAIRNMGTNIIPFLMTDIKQTDGLIGRIIGWTTDLSNPLEKTRWQAARAFAILGPQAKDAVPQLASLLNDSATSEIGKDVAYALAGIGAISILTNSMKTNAWTEYAVAWALGQFPANAQSAVPSLLDCLQNTNSWGRTYTLWSLQQIVQKPEEIFPILTNALGDPDFQVRITAACSLTNLGETARPAVPLLLNLLSNGTLYERQHMEIALKKIAPEALTNTSHQLK